MKFSLINWLFSRETKNKKPPSPGIKFSIENLSDRKIYEKAREIPNLLKKLKEINLQLQQKEPPEKWGLKKEAFEEYTLFINEAVRRQESSLKKAEAEKENLENKTYLLGKILNLNILGWKPFGSVKKKKSESIQQDIIAFKENINNLRQYLAILEQYAPPPPQKFMSSHSRPMNITPPNKKQKKRLAEKKREIEKEEPEKEARKAVKLEKEVATKEIIVNNCVNIADFFKTNVKKEGDNQDKNLIDNNNTNQMNEKNPSNAIKK
jgi:hypothetical protein